MSLLGRFFKSLPWVYFALPLAAAGCAAPSTLPSLREPGQYAAMEGGASALMERASEVGFLWPLTVVGFIALLGGVVALISGAKGTAISLLAVGLTLAVLPAFAFEVLGNLVLPVSLGLGFLAIVGVAYVCGVAWMKWKVKRRLENRGNYIKYQVPEENLTPGSVKKVLDHIMDPKFDSKKDVKE
tara:strand:- start:10169 stop:10723 length:555 start_codon:yes stop_codon:yes gene_type:complete